jgi:hypothetical protein
MIVGGGRCVGKTYNLIKESRRTQIPILCATRDHARMIEMAARNMSEKIPKPLTVDELRFHGGRPEVLVDEIEMVLSYAIGTYVVHATTSQKLRTLSKIK